MAHRALLLIAAWLPVAAAAAPDPALVGALDAAKPGAVSGTVTRASTGQGVPDVTVQLLHLDGTLSEAAFTDADGRYFLKPRHAGTYFVRALGTADLAGTLFNGVFCPLGCDPATGTPITVSGGVTRIDLLLDAGGRLSGRVIDAATGEPIPDVDVRIWDHTGRLITRVTTERDGGYLVAPLPAGVFYVSTLSSGYLDRLSGGLPCLQSLCNPLSGTPVEVRRGEETAGIEFALTKGGSVSGTVYDEETGEPATGVGVAVRDPEGRTVAGSVSGDGGRYTASGLVTGTYYVLVPAAQENPGELYDGVACAPTSCDLSLGTAVGVIRDADTDGIDFRIVRTTGQGSLSGRVTEQDSGQPLRGISIYVQDYQGRQYVGEATSDPDGTYRVSDVPAGRVYVRTLNLSSLGYFGEIYDDIPCGDPFCDGTAGAPVVIADGVETRGVDFELVLGGSISGRVTDESGHPVEQVSVGAYDQDGGLAAGDLTDARGRYTIAPLATGAYFVQVLASEGRLGEVFDDVTCSVPICDVTAGQPIGVEEGVVTQGIDFVLRQGATLAGRVVDEATGYGISGARVLVYDEQGATLVLQPSGERGDYTLRGLPSGSYFAGTFNTAGYLDEVFADVECPFLTCDVTAGTTVPLDAGTATEGVDFALGRGGSISGRVTEEATGLPFRQNAALWVYDAAGSYVDAELVDPNGNYKVSGLAGGAYFVRTDNGIGLDELHRGVPCILGCDVTTGTPVLVRQGDETHGIDFALTLGGRLLVTVTNRETGHIVPDVLLDLFTKDGLPAFSTTIQRSGTGLAQARRAGVGALPAGTYFVRASAPGFTAALYDGVPCDEGCDVTAGTPVIVRVNEITSGIDFVLDPAPATKP